MNVLKSFALICAVTAGFAAVAARSAAAEDAVMMGRNASECEIAAGLGVAKPECPQAVPPAASAPQIRTRGLSIGNMDQMPVPPPPSAASPSAPPRQHAASARRHSAAFQITFEFGSARLTSDALEVLDRIGKVLSTPDAGTVKFRITGHTDGVGSAHRNQELSEARAEAVKDYLVAHFGISDARLQAVGRGSRELINRGDPSASENRRVEVTNLGG